MGRTSKVVTSGLLILALAAVTVPAGINLVPALLPKDPAAVVAATPAAQLAPRTLSTLTGIAPPAADAPLPKAGTLAADMAAALAFDGAGQFSAYVADASTGKALYSDDGDELRAPASNLKLLTAVAALKTLGPATRLSTSVVAGANPNTLVLKAGGDSMLTPGDSDPNAVMGHAGLATLAKDTATALAKAGVKGPVTISVDDTLFTGPALNPHWDSGDVEVGEIAPIYPMALYGGRSAPVAAAAPRPADSALAVADAFTDALHAAGINTAGEIARAKAPETPAAGTAKTAPGTVLASVSSATVAEQVQYLLVESDNYVAEVMARLVAARENLEATNSGAVTAVRQVLAGLGLPLDGATSVDNCGLGRGNLISAHQLAQVVSYIVAHSDQEVGAALPGFPIAGLTGTLDNRFASPNAQAAAGLVRAKTGTLNQVSALSGYVINAQGRLLVFSIIGNKLTAGPGSATPVIDAAAAVLAKS
ncbi:hypothetical protein AL755_00720 (plasmid) [Arthrobacter sp. ERGS1:01]|uniref:D-alanyl-D-alanine carboxypeptidase/D-alanyl-D-alanine endopeptidase n=1 Tax=Arthrobacter sp. ERGS1:01 TaxID=1704044 RepID=UPI0006CB20AF|nr:D-alanyl-D-alanine carboxypeptidase/D-alanyl-D-alanine-endopeptidase [Arthrobacter sp. ERGS1:01]ALE04272.1 hypothetical protein AL755_00720 [Arthrobacter sp. ERGS1:01]